MADEWRKVQQAASFVMATGRTERRNLGGWNPPSGMGQAMRLPVSTAESYALRQDRSTTFPQCEFDIDRELPYGWHVGLSHARARLHCKFSVGHLTKMHRRALAHHPIACPSRPGGRLGHSILPSDFLTDDATQHAFELFATHRLAQSLIDQGLITPPARL